MHPLLFEIPPTIYFTTRCSFRGIIFLLTQQMEKSFIFYLYLFHRFTWVPLIHTHVCCLVVGNLHFSPLQVLKSTSYTDDSVICKHLSACLSPQQTRRGSEPILLELHPQHITTALIHVRHHWNILPCNFSPTASLLFLLFNVHLTLSWSTLVSCFTLWSLSRPSFVNSYDKYSFHFPFNYCYLPMHFNLDP